MNQQELSHALRKEAIKQGHSVQTVASGYSMFPFLRKGDLLTVEPVPMERIKRGDIVVFESEEKWIAHRVIKIHSNDGLIGFTTRGDARVSRDPVINKTNYIGLVPSIERGSQKISLLSFQKKISSQVHLIGGFLLSRSLNYFIRSLNALKSTRSADNKARHKI